MDEPETKQAFTSAASASSMLDLMAQLYVSPELYPVEVSVESGTISFNRLTAADYRDLSFLTGGWFGTDESQNAYRFQLEPFLRRFERARPESKPVHFVFHHALTASTLFSRTLQAVAAAHPVREPAALNTLSTDLARARLAGKADPLGPALRMLLHLLGRTLAPEEQSVVKLADSGALSADELLEASPRGRGLFLYTDLRTHVLASLRVPEREKWLRGRVKWLNEGLFPGVGPVELDAETAPPARIAAALWSAHAAAMREALGRWGPTRLRTLPTDLFLAAPERIAVKAADFFGLVRNTDRAALEETLSRHAKQGGDYGAEQRRSDLSSVESTSREDVDDACDWALETFGIETAVPDLPHPLMRREPV